MPGFITESLLVFNTKYSFVHKKMLLCWIEFYDQNTCFEHWNIENIKKNMTTMDCQFVSPFLLLSYSLFHITCWTVSLTAVFVY